MRTNSTLILTGLLLALSSPAKAELLAVMTYESKPDQEQRKEGIAIMELDRASPRFGQIIRDIPLPADLVAHHVYLDPTATKVYITALGKSELRIMDIKTYDVTVVPVPGCQVGEDIAFSRKTGLWYLTCMGSSVMVVGDPGSAKPLRTVHLPAPYPHGIAVHDDIDRILLTSTVRPSDLKDPGDVIQELELSTEKPVTTHKIGAKPSPAGSAPVEVQFIPNGQPPKAYTTAMNDGALWLGLWDAAGKAFTWRQVVDFAAMGQGLPLEVYYNDKGTRAYVSTAKPGHLNIFDITRPESPRLLHTVKTGGGAHHMVFSPDQRFAYVQNSFINLPDMHEGTISVVDTETGTVVATIDTLSQQGLTPNNIELLSGGHH
ncbi:MAG: YncE family protein [Alphaproteobacteria bacterium]